VSARHQYVADDLRRRIASGVLTAGERLPSERQLSAHYRVSTPTLRDALGVLQAEGLIEKVQGRGNFVRQPPPRFEYPGADTAGLHIVVSFAAAAATGEVAVRLGVRPDAAVTQYVCLAHRGDSPQSLTHLYVPYAVGASRTPATTTSPWADDILDHLATRAGAPVARAVHQVTARFPTEAEAQSLRIATRTPVLAIERQFLAEQVERAEQAGRAEHEEKSERVLAYALIVLPGDRARVAFTTSHPDQKGATR
jgi:GntR family transcriptional regulator